MDKRKSGSGALGNQRFFIMANIVENRKIETAAIFA